MATKREQKELFDTAATPEPDEFEGWGGSYELTPDGKRRLIERTAPGEVTQPTQPDDKE